MAALPRQPRRPTFWLLQLGGWLLYGLAIAAASIPFRHEREYVAYRAVFLLSGFLASFAMYLVCRSLWQRNIRLFPSLVVCSFGSGFLGLLCSLSSVWSETQVKGSKMVFRWDSVFAGSPGSAFVLIAWAGFYFGIKHYYALEEERTRLLASESLRREAQLQALRYQLQPHFLFNTLNAISTLVLDNEPRKATQMISRLADLLRHTLDAPEVHMVPVAEELAVVEEYLEIEKVRLGARLQVHYEIEEQARLTLVPRLLIQPLIENAIRHGIAKLPRGGAIQLYIAQQEGTLEIEITNEIPPPEHPKPTTGFASRQAGLGLANARARLHQLYGSTATLLTEMVQDRVFRVSISIPAKKSATTLDRKELPTLQ